MMLLGGLTACSQPPAPPTERVVVETRVVHDAPPPPRHEERFAAPGPPERFAWDPGHWESDGHQYQWRSGNWIERHDQNRTWVPAHWTQTPNGWVMTPGTWR